MLMVVKLKIPLVGTSKVTSPLVLMLSGPSAPVLPELNCASVMDGLMTQSIITS